jgi:selenide,water dikinase
VLLGLTSVRDPELLVGYETSDDAAVYRLFPELAVISTADFITPPVDDPTWFGRIAAANALSDIYAMGGRPVLALNLVMFPAAELGAEVLGEVLRGGLEKTTEAGAALAGGHSVEDREPKYGLAVTGVVHPERIWTNCRALPGDALVLTKPLGTGVLFNACRSRKLPSSELLPLLPEIAGLNRRAAEVASAFEIHAATDVTGFGLAGHALEVARGSRVRLAIDYSALPVYPLALEMYRRGQTTGANRPNRALAAGGLEIGERLTAEEQELLFDPQTSGGLLLSVLASQADELTAALRSAGISAAARVAEVSEDPTGLGRLCVR